MKTIEILVAPSGESRIATHGLTGRECREASRFLESALGQRTAEILTAEYHQQPADQQNRVNERG